LAAVTATVVVVARVGARVVVLAAKEVVLLGLLGTYSLLSLLSDELGGR